MRHDRSIRILAALALAVASWSAAGQQAAPAALPSSPDAVKFAVIGDNGTGDPPQYQVADQMVKSRAGFAFDRVIMLGDNIYGGQGPQDLVRKFAQPYKALLDAGVTFYASLGNHDAPINRNYPLWNMGGNRYLTHAVKNVRFFVLDSNQIDRGQLAWLEKELASATEDWKIPYFHHPMYSDGGRHGSSVDVRVLFEPLFLKYGVNVVFAGHDHIYERLVPQKGIHYFVEGSSGELRRGDGERSAMTASLYDQDRTFMLVGILGDVMTFQAISRTGTVVDSGTIRRQQASQ